jgi:hypothetical protein
MQKETLSSTETARQLKHRVDYILMLTRSGILLGEKRDGRWLIDRDSVEAYRERQRSRRMRAESAAKRRQRNERGGGNPPTTST